MATIHIQSAVADLLKVRHPVLLAGMGNVATKKLCAAVSNAGGLGVLGGYSYKTAEILKREIDATKAELRDPTAFGIDFLLPQVGGGARKTNHDYTRGRLPAMIDVICGSGCRLFVVAVGVPPRWAVDKLHAAGVLIMNMVGHPKHIDKALAAGADLICAQGHEAGGHSGEVTSLVLIPQCVDRCKGRTSPLTGGPVHVIAAGGIYDGRTMAAALALGAEAVWVGTRFLASSEATMTKQHREALLRAGPSDTFQTTAATGRPARVYKNQYYLEWEGARKAEAEGLRAKGVVPATHDVKVNKVSLVRAQALGMGQAAGAIDSILPAGEILRSMVEGAASVLGRSGGRVSRL